MRCFLVAICLLALPAALAAQTAHFGGAMTTLSTGFAFNEPTGVAVDASGNVFVADASIPGVFEIQAVAGVVNSTSTVVQIGTSFSFTGPTGVAVDGSGDVFVADPTTANGIYEIEASGAVIPVGSGFSNPQGVAVDANGNVFVADSNNHAVEEILAVSGHVSSSSVVTTIASRGISQPVGVAVDASGNVFVADAGANDEVEELSPVGGVYPSPSSPGIVSNVFSTPQGVAVDANGNVFATDLTTFKVTEVLSINGTLSSSSPTYSIGAGFVAPYGVAVDSRGTVYVADTGNARVLKLQAESANFGLQPVGAASPAALPLTFTFDTGGTIAAPAVLTQGATGLDFTDALTGTCATVTTYNTGDSCTVNVTFTPTAPGFRYGAVQLLNTSSVVIATGYVYGTGVGGQATMSPALFTTIAGTLGSYCGSGPCGDGGAATSAGFAAPEGVLLDATGRLYIADSGGNRIRLVDLSGNISTVAGDGTMCSPASAPCGDTGPALSAQLSNPTGMATDGAGNLYIADENDNRIRVVSASTGAITTVAGTGSPCSAPGCGDGAAAVNAQLSQPTQVAVDGAGNLYIADQNDSRIRKVTAFTGLISTVAGTGTFCSSPPSCGDGLAATSAQLYNPFGVAVDGAGDIFIADSNDNEVREVTAATGIITTVAGTGVACSAPCGDGGPAVGAQLNLPSAVAVDAAGNLYIADSGEFEVRRVSAATGLISSLSTNGLGFYFDLAPAANGDLYIADIYNRVVRKVTASAGVAAFAAYAVGVSSPAIDVTLNNSGNFALNLSALAASANFNLAGSDTTCTSSIVIALGADCILGIEFLPTAVGPLTGTVTLTPAASNVAAATVALSGTGVAPPTLTSITPTFGPAVGGTSVSIVGTGFTNTTAVTFGVIAATSFTINSDTSITAVAPAQAPGTIDVTVTSAGATTATGPADQFTYIAPVVTAVSPPAGTAAGGTSVTITGTALSPATGVSFGGIAAVIVSNTATQIVATSPSAPAATVDVTVTTAYGTSATSAADEFQYTLSEPVTTASQTLTATLTIVSADTVASIGVFTQGAANLDFQLAPGGTCTTAAYTAGQTCTVLYTFTPTRPGARYGAAVLYNSSGVPLATAYLSGTGSGPQVIFPPGMLSTVGSGFNDPRGVAVDGAGNIFVADAGNNAVKEIAAVNGAVSSGSTVNTISSGFNAPAGVAVDGAGNVFVADYHNNVVEEIVAANGAVSSSSTVTTVASGFNGVSGVAVDGAGDVFVTDYVNDALKEIVAVNGVVSSASAVITVRGGFNRPYGVAVDSSGDIFVVDYGNSAVKEIVAANGVVSSSSMVITVGSGFSYPTGAAVDSAGNVFVVDDGNNALKEIVAVGGAVSSSSAVIPVGSGFSYPIGVAVDSRDNLFVGDFYNNAVKEIDFVDPPSLTFASTADGSTSSDSPQTVTVTNNGNATLTFEASGAASAGFTLGGSSTCAATLASGASCTELVSFTPATLGLITGSLVTTDNALNAPSPYATQTVALSGTGTAPLPAVTAVSPPTGTAAGGTSVTITGANLLGATGVRFGGIAVAIVSNTATQIVTTSPSAPAGTVDVTVTTANGTSLTNPADEFTYTLSEPVATASQTLTATLTFTTAGTVASIGVFTKGITGLDFQVAPGGTCTTAAYTAGQTCTVNYTFTPIRPGARYGAVVLSDSSGVPLATAYLSGAGDGPQVSFPPGTLSTVGSGFSAPDGVAVDGAGDVFVVDYGRSAVYEIVAVNGVVSPSSAVNPVGGGFSYPEKVAVDGAGNVFVADTSHSAVKEIVAVNGAVSSSSTVNIVGAGFGYPAGVAVDGAGNVFVADQANNAVKEILAVNGAVSSSSTVATINSSFSSTADVAVDAQGNVFVADEGNNAVKEIVAVNGAVSSSSTVITIGGGFSYPLGVAVDGSGNVFVADYYNSAVKEIVAVNGAVSSSSTVTTIGGGFNYPGGVGVDSSGNVFVADSSNAAVKEVDSVDPPSLTFASTAVGSTSSDSPQTVTVTNNGNAALTFEAPGATSAGFTLSGSSTCAATLAAGASCTELVSFTPATVGSPITGSLVATDNALNAASPYATQTIPLTGIATPAPLTAAASVPSRLLTQNHAATAFTPVTGSGGTGPLTYSLSAPLPAGLSFSSATGMVSGTSTAVSAATTYTVTVTDANGATATANFSLTVNPALSVPAAIPPVMLTQGQPASFIPVVASGGTGTLTYTVSAPLPPGLSLSPTTGVVSGTPTAVSPPTPTTVTVTDANGATTTATFTLTVNVPVVATLVIPAELLIQGRGASFTPVTGSGGTGTLTYSVSPALGAGLSFSSSTGAVSGTPTAVTAATTYTVTVTDSNGAAATASFRLTVNSPAAATATSLSASPTTQLAGNPVVLTAQVTSATAGTLTGTVNFLDGTTPIATAPVGANGQAAYADSALSAGDHSLTAAYSGDAYFLPSSSAALPLAITVASINLVLTGDQSETAVPGFPVTYNLSLAPLVTTTFLYDVHLTATGLPPGATYTFTPSTIPAGSGPVPVAFAVQTAKTTGMLGSSRRAWFALVFGLLLPLAGAKRFRARLLLGALTLSLVAGLGGCGSGGFFGAPKGQSSYTITIVATSGTLVRTTTVQLNLE